MAMQKKSRKRDAILACVCSTDTHPTAEWVYTQLKPDIPDLSLGTVYRNLAMFRREGIIGSAGVVNGLERYDRNPLPHAHFVCTQCSAVYDLPDIEPPVGLMRRVTCGCPSTCELTFTGVCNDCISPDAESKITI